MQDSTTNRELESYFNMVRTSKINQLEMLIYCNEISALINQPIPPENTTALMRAAEEGNIPLLQCLLKAPTINVNLKSPSGATALSLAVMNKKEQSVSLLLSNTTLDVTESTLAYAFNNKQDPVFLWIYTLLIHAVLQAAITNNYMEGVQRLTPYLSADTLNQWLYPENNTTPLILATALGKTALLAHFLKNEHLKVNEPARSGHTALHIAIEKQSDEMVTLLLNAPGLTIDWSHFLCARTHHSALLNQLYRFAFKPQPNMKVDLATQVLAFVSTAANYAAFAAEVKEWINTINPINKMTPLMYAASEGDLKAFNAILKVATLDINLQTAGEPKKSAFLFAVEQQNEEMVELFLQLPNLAIERDMDAAMELARNNRSFSIKNRLENHKPNNELSDGEWLDINRITIPDHFLCPIIRDFLVDPVCVPETGRTYSREALIKHFEANGEPGEDGEETVPCPITRIEMSKTVLNNPPNLSLIGAMNDFIAQCKAAFSKKTKAASLQSAINSVSASLVTKENKSNLAIPESDHIILLEESVSSKPVCRFFNPLHKEAKITLGKRDEEHDALDSNKRQKQ
ncbi:MAG: ankyrin repeat domain-containing RING finger protein [Tatlockia sp.]|jgi:ankyrin repeat protein